MFVEAVEHIGGRKAVIKAGQVVIYDDVGNPIVVAVQTDTGTYHAATVADLDLSKMLATIGLGHIRTHVYRLNQNLPILTPPSS